MLAEIAVTNDNDDINNILLSLEYLKEEAKRSDNLTLYEIIETACILGRMNVTKLDACDFEAGDEDLFRSALFLLKFYKASKIARENVLEILTEEIA